MKKKQEIGGTARKDYKGANSTEGFTPLNIDEVGNLYRVAMEFEGKHCFKCDKVFKNNRGYMIHLGKTKNSSHKMIGLAALEI